MNLPLLKELPHTRSCFVCGESNAAGLKLRFHTDGRVVFARFTPKPEHIGFQQVVHGGILSTVLDEIMVWACVVATRRFAYCVELRVSFHRAAAPGVELTASAELVSNRRDRIFEAKSELRNPAGEVVCSATGKYFAVKGEQTAALLRDVIGPLDW